MLAGLVRPFLSTPDYTYLGLLGRLDPVDDLSTTGMQAGNGGRRLLGRRLLVVWRAVHLSLEYDVLALEALHGWSRRDVVGGL